MYSIVASRAFAFAFAAQAALLAAIGLVTALLGEASRSDVLRFFGIYAAVVVAAAALALVFLPWLRRLVDDAEALPPTAAAPGIAETVQLVLIRGTPGLNPFARFVTALPGQLSILALGVLTIGPEAGVIIGGLSAGAAAGGLLGALVIRSWERRRSATLYMDFERTRDDGRRVYYIDPGGPKEAE
jgi:hypothetical protein